MFEDDEAVQAFRADYRSWLNDHRPPQLPPPGERTEAAVIDVQRQWLRTLDDGGWSAPHWPVAYGGRAATLPEQIVIHEENSRAGTPPMTTFGVGLSHTAATLLSFGTEAQRQRFLAPIRRGATIWCQGFSEPDAGSDLASLKTRAVRDGDNYVVNGQKIWSSGAHRSDWCLLLARTDPDVPKHRGISFFLVDLHSKGVEVRPIRTAMGTHHFCEVFYDDVIIPADQRIGDENQGWQIAQTTLSTERGSYFLPMVSQLRLQITDLAERLRDSPQRQHAEQVVARHHHEVTILSELVEQTLVRAAFGRSGPESSIIKLHYSELAQRLSRDAMELLGPASIHAWEGEFYNNSELFDGNFARAYFWSFGNTIGGGTSEIQRNLIAERVLGLPREPRVDTRSA
jgi:alkylation response protein AidB-like acyl-CoA dehydrogenase